MCVCACDPSRSTLRWDDGCIRQRRLLSFPQEGADDRREPGPVPASCGSSTPSPNLNPDPSPSPNPNPDTGPDLLTLILTLTLTSQARIFFFYPATIAGASVASWVSLTRLIAGLGGLRVRGRGGVG